jgi:predicted deacetylase
MNSSVQLVLKTTDISTTATAANYYNLPGTVTTAIGQVSQTRTSMTWYNINMRA